MDAQDRLFGEIAVRLQLLSREQVAACIHTQQGEGAGKRIGEVALALSFISPGDVELVLEQQRRVLERRREARPADKPLAGAVKEERPLAAAVQDERPTSRDRRADLTQPVDAPESAPKEAKLAASRYDEIVDPPAHAAAAPKRAMGQTLKGAAEGIAPARSHSLELGATLTARTAPVVALQPSAAVPSGRGKAPAESKAAREPERPAAAAAPMEDYDFGAPAPAPQATRADAAGLADKPRNVATAGTLVQPFVAAAKRVPADRAWRNPSRPPPTDQPPIESEAAPAAANPSTRKSGTLAWVAAPQPPSAGAAPVKPAQVAARPIAQRPAPATSEAAYLDRVLKLSQEAGASDLHAHSGAPLLARVDGTLWPLSGNAPLPAAAAERVIAEIMSDEQWEALMQDGDVGFAHEVPGVGRFRAHAFRQEHGVGITLRVLSRRAPTPDELGLPARLPKLCNAGPGLYLFTGPLGSGKSSTLTALLDAVADERSWHVVSVERPIEIVYAARRAFIVQREVPAHAPSLAAGIELALRDNPDAIVISDLQEADAVQAALRAARAGCHVFACLRASSAVQTLARMLEAFSADEQPSARNDLADYLRLVVSQRLLPRATGRGRVPALELLVASAQVSHLIRDDKLLQIGAVLAAGKAAGMQALDDSLEDLLRTGTITADTALRSAQKKERFTAG